MGTQGEGRQAGGKAACVCVPLECGGPLTALEGHFSTPSHPQPYPHQQVREGMPAGWRQEDGEGRQGGRQPPAGESCGVSLPGFMGVAGFPLPCSCASGRSQCPLAMSSTCTSTTSAWSHMRTAASTSWRCMTARPRGPPASWAGTDTPLISPALLHQSGCTGLLWLSCGN